MEPTATKCQSLGQLAIRVLVGALFIAAATFRMHAHGFYFPYVVAVGSSRQEISLPLAYLVELGAACALVAGWRARWAAGILLFYTVAQSVLLPAATGFPDPDSGARLAQLASHAAVLAGLACVAACGGGRYGADAARAGA